jgi:iron complex outermembrane receptor protein
MNRSIFAVRALAGVLCAASLNVAAQSLPREFDIPPGELKAAIDTYAMQSGVQLIYKTEDVKGLLAKGVKGKMAPEQALEQLLEGTPMKVRRDETKAVVIFRPAAGELPRAAAEAETGELQTVTVTAQKRPEAAQSVPISLTTFSPKALERFRISSLADVARLTPGLLVSAFSQNSPTIAIRGANNTFSQIGVSKPVAVVIDDVFIPRNSAASFELFDLDSIAVLKGPQGTLFGRNVTGGAIVIGTRKPSFDVSEFEARATVGNLDARQLDVLAGVPLSEAAAVKLSASVHARDGYGVDRLTGQATDDVDSKNLRTQLRLAPASGLEALLSADYSHDRNGGRTLSSVTLGDDGDRRTAEAGVPQGFVRSIWGSSAKVEWDTGTGQLTSISAYRKSRSDEDYAGVAANFVFLTSGSQALVSDADQVGTFSQELRYTSPKWERADFIAGLYYLNEDGKRQLGNRGLAAKTGALVSSTWSDQAVRTISYAAFVDGVLHLAPTLDLAAGARYTYDDKTASLARYDVLKPANNFFASDLDASWHEITPRIALTWRPAPDAMLYASVTRGFTAGGFNTEASSLKALTTPFNPETVTNYETGLKSQWLGNRLRFNASFFRMKYKDKQEFLNNSLTGILSIFNASSATIKGAELELAYKPNQVLGLSLNYGRLDSVYDSFVVANINNTGNPLASSPRNKFSAAADFSVPQSYGYLFGAASYAWIDHYNTGAANDPNLMIPAYALLNFSLGVASPDRRYKLTAWVKNAADTSYILTRSTQVVRAEYLGEPRTFGLSLGVKF